MHTCASVRPGSAVRSVGAVTGVVAEELHCSRSERSSLEVALEQVPIPLSVVGLETDEATLSEAVRIGLDRPCSMNGTPPKEGNLDFYTMVQHAQLSH